MFDFMNCVCAALFVCSILCFHVMLWGVLSWGVIRAVGTSVTTGQSNCVVWNGVHHKTNTSGGATNFGWPDPTYFVRVKEELKDKGIEP